MRPILALFLLCLAYALVRYVAFDPKNAQNIPLFILNKGVSMAGALCFLVAFATQRRQDHAQPPRLDPAAWFRAGLFAVVWHIPMALALLRPAYFKEFFALAPDDPNPRLNLPGELVVCLGSFAAAGAFLLVRPAWTAIVRWRLSLAFVLALLAHTLCMGIPRGLNVDAKHAFLPPMWLLSALGCAAAVGFLLRARPPAQGPS